MICHPHPPRLLQLDGDGRVCGEEGVSDELPVPEQHSLSILYCTILYCTVLYLCTTRSEASSGTRTPSITGAAISCSRLTPPLWPAPPAQGGDHDDNNDDDNDDDNDNDDNNDVNDFTIVLAL